MRARPRWVLVGNGRPATRAIVARVGRRAGPPERRQRAPGRGSGPNHGRVGRTGRVGGAPAAALARSSLGGADGPGRARSGRVRRRARLGLPARRQLSLPFRVGARVRAARRPGARLAAQGGPGGGGPAPEPGRRCRAGDPFRGMGSDQRRRIAECRPPGCGLAGGRYRSRARRGSAACGQPSAGRRSAPGRGPVCARRAGPGRGHFRARHASRGGADGVEPGGLPGLAGARCRWGSLHLGAAPRSGQRPRHSWPLRRGPAAPR